MKTVGLCNEWVGCYVDAQPAVRLRHARDRPGARRREPLPARDGAARRRRRRLRPPARAARRSGAAPRPSRSGWIRPSELGWRRSRRRLLDASSTCIENNRGALRALPRFGVLPGSGDHHSVEFMPGFVHPGNDYGSGMARAHYGMPRHIGATPTTTSSTTRRSATPTDVTRMPSGELVATLLDGMVDRPGARPSRQPAERGQRDEPARRRGRRDHGHRRRGRGARPRHARRCPAIMGEYLRRVNVVAGVDGRGRARPAIATLVLEAMLADPMARRSSRYDDVVAMTDEMLAATARWLPQFAALRDRRHGTADRHHRRRELPVGAEAVRRHREHAVARRGRDRAAGHRPRAAAGRWPTSSQPRRRGRGHRHDGRDDHRPARRARRRRLRRRHASRPAAFASMRHDLEIPERHGIKQSVGDTVGPGGIMRALRNIPVLVGIARDMEERLSRRVDAQHHEPDDHAVPRGDTRDDDQDRRAVPRDHGARSSRCRSSSTPTSATSTSRSPASTTCRSSPRCASTATTAFARLRDLLADPRRLRRRADAPAAAGSATSDAASAAASRKRDLARRATA